MTFKENNNVKYCVFDKFMETGLVSMGFSTKFGGVSTGVCESMNLTYNTSDSLENVAKNFELYLDAIGANKNSVIMSEKQIHGKEVFCVTENFTGTKFIKGVDGFVTNLRNITLITNHADCVPLYFLDPVKKVIGLSHSGWRGTVLGIGKETVFKMVNNFGSNPNDILAGIGPSIGKCCFETDSDVPDLFKENYSFCDNFIFEKENGKYFVDIKGINKEILKSAGIPEKNILVSDICTMCSSDIFFSHRKMKQQRGTMAAAIMLK